ncbi:MAG TPA: HEAT repeat domain-containing protein [Planctomycetota bacterium]|nr:HEAT repeat domain-containing protein [Planctomycetota bacterium]
MEILLALALFLQDADPAAELRKKLDDEKSLPVAQRGLTIAAAGALRSDPAALLLGEFYDKEKDAALRILAIKALFECGTASATKKVASIAGDPKAPSACRAAALKGLTDAKTKEGLELCKSIIKEPAELRIDAFNALLRFYPLTDTEKIWRDALAGEIDPIVKGLALTALAPLKEVKLQDFSTKALLNPNEDAPVKYGAIEVLRSSPNLATTRLFLGLAPSADQTMRRLLSEALGTITENKWVEEIFGALHHKDPAIRLVAARSLGRLKHERAMAKLEEPLKDPNHEVRAAALESVAERKDKSSEAILQKEAQKSDEDTATLAVALLVQYPSDSTKALLLKLASSYKPGVAVPALEALAELRAPEAFGAFEKALQAKEWPIRVVAIRGLGRLKTKESIDLLVERMPKEEGRVLAEIGDALRASTGKGIGYAPGGWKEWWTASREAFVFPDGVATAQAAAGMTTYHGVPVLSNRICFVLDISGSMSEQLGDDTRLGHAKKELVRVLGALGKEAQADVIFFDDRLEPFAKQLMPVKPNLPKMLALIQQVKPRGRTNIFDALDLAMQLKEVDTIYFLSDGDPTDGRVIDPADILREVRRLNRLRQIVIHTVAIPSSPFLKALAEQNGGQYVEVK